MVRDQRVYLGIHQDVPMNFESASVSRLDPDRDHLASYVRELLRLYGAGVEQVRRAVVEDDLNGLLTRRLPLQVTPHRHDAPGKRSQKEQSPEQLPHRYSPPSRALSTSSRALRMS
jgi:hypothetical protein